MNMLKQIIFLSNTKECEKYFLSFSFFLNKKKQTKKTNDLFYFCTRICKKNLKDVAIMQSEYIKKKYY